MGETIKNLKVDLKNIQIQKDNYFEKLTLDREA